MPTTPEPSANAAVVHGPGSPCGQFPNTQWSMVLHAHVDGDTTARTGLESLCRRYWQPLYIFVRRHGRNHHEAEDATQQFLAHLLATDGLRLARPERGRFRTFLLTALHNFLTSDWRRAHAAKRGGGLAPLALEPTEPGEARAAEAIDPCLTPEQAFDRSWALSLIDRAVVELCAEYESGGRRYVFDALAPLIWGHESGDDLASRAAAIGLSANAFRVALHRARSRFGQRLRAIVADTVSDPDAIDAELRHLIAAIGGTTPRR